MTALDRNHGTKKESLERALKAPKLPPPLHLSNGDVFYSFLTCCFTNSHNTLRQKTAVSSVYQVPPTCATDHVLTTGTQTQWHGQFLNTSLPSPPSCCLTRGDDGWGCSSHPGPLRSISKRKLVPRAPENNAPTLDRLLPEREKQLCGLRHCYFEYFCYTWHGSSRPPMILTHLLVSTPCVVCTMMNRADGCNQRMLRK